MAANASKAAFLENYLAVSTWILDGSSIEYQEKKRQRFSLFKRRQVRSDRHDDSCSALFAMGSLN